MGAHTNSKLDHNKDVGRYKKRVIFKQGKKLTIGPSSRPLAPSSWEPGLLIVRTGIPVSYIRHKQKLCFKHSLKV